MEQIQKILEIGLEKYKEEHKVIGYKQNYSPPHRRGWEAWRCHNRFYRLPG